MGPETPKGFYNTRASSHPRVRYATLGYGVKRLRRGFLQRQGIDKGNQAGSGSGAIVLGDIAKPDDGTWDYVLISRHNRLKARPTSLQRVCVASFPGS